MDVVDTADDAAGLELPPLVVRAPLEAFLDEHGIGEGRVEVERIGEGHSNITFLVRAGRRARRAAPPAAAAAAAVCPRRAARGAPAARPRGHAGAGAARCWRWETTRTCSAFPSTSWRRCTGRARELHPRRTRHAGRARPHLPRSWWTRSWRCTPSTGAHAGSRATASRPAIWSVRCAASAGCGSTTRPASWRWCEELGEWLARQHAGLAGGHDRPRGLPARQRDDARLRAGRAGRDLRLGAVHDRRPARGPGLHDGHVGRVRRPAGHDVRQPERGHAPRGLPQRATS